MTTTTFILLLNAFAQLLGAIAQLLAVIRRRRWYSYLAEPFQQERLTLHGCQNFTISPLMYGLRFVDLFAGCDRFSLGLWI